MRPFGLAWLRSRWVKEQRLLGLIHWVLRALRARMTIHLGIRVSIDICMLLTMVVNMTGWWFLDSVSARIIHGRIVLMLDLWIRRIRGAHF